jgi:hypothetical protein
MKRFAKVPGIKPAPAAPRQGSTKRLTLDMPAALYRRFKVACAKHRLSMTGEAIDLIKLLTADLEAT